MRLIDADELKSHLDRLKCGGGSANDREIVDKMLHKAFPQIIDEEPTIGAQPVKRGKWLEVRRHRDADGCIVTDYKCSECGIMLRDTNPDDRDSEFYCYHCGARMEVEEDGDQV